MNFSWADIGYYIPELIIFNTPLDHIDRNRVGYYLQQKYGMTGDYVDPQSADLGVGMMLMRPIDHGILNPDPALRFALGYFITAPSGRLMSTQLPATPRQRRP